jgi:SAM-dependent methyltransferase
MVGVVGDAQFNLTNCVDVVHHLSNRIGVFDEALRVLKTGGALCLATDSENIIRSREPLSVYWPETVEAELARYPYIETLRAELREAGFVLLSALDVASRGFLTDSGPYRAKVFPCLRSLSEESTNRAWHAWKPTLFKGQCHLQASIRFCGLRRMAVKGIFTSGLSRDPVVDQILACKNRFQTTRLRV